MGVWNWLITRNRQCGDWSLPASLQTQDLFLALVANHSSMVFWSVYSILNFGGRSRQWAWWGYLSTSGPWHLTKYWNTLVAASTGGGWDSVWIRHRPWNIPSLGDTECTQGWPIGRQTQNQLTVLKALAARCRQSWSLAVLTCWTAGCPSKHGWSQKAGSQAAAQSKVWLLSSLQKLSFAPDLTHFVAFLNL